MKGDGPVPARAGAEVLAVICGDFHSVVAARRRPTAAGSPAAMPRALSGRPEAEIGSGLSPALRVRCYRRKRAQGGVIGHNDNSLTGEVITGRIAVIQAFLQAVDPYLRFSRVSGSRGESLLRKENGYYSRVGKLRREPPA